MIAVVFSVKLLIGVSGGGKTWSEGTPKAALMARKRAVIVDAAQQSFLENGYADSSVSRTAAEAGVSIKTLYLRFRLRGWQRRPVQMLITA